MDYLSTMPEIRPLNCVDDSGASPLEWVTIPIPCTNDSDCNQFNAEKFCKPWKVNVYECGFRDFCGEDRFCKHDCSLR